MTVPTTSPPSAQPLYFGASGGLFGLFHPATGPATTAILLCAPLGQEHIRCHRVYRQLARALAAKGIAVLRFDYHGCGDSCGDDAEVDWDHCVTDTVVAADALRGLAETDRVLAFGARLGGNIALSAAAAARLSGLLLWDPVLDGAELVHRMDALQSALCSDPRRFARPRSTTDAAGQWLGFAVSDRLRRQLHYLRVPRTRAAKVVFDSMPVPGTARWRPLAPRRVHALRPATPWLDPQRLEMAILSHALVQAVVASAQEIA